MLDFDANKIFLTNNKEETALELFQFQYQHNFLYQQYVQSLGVLPNQVRVVRQIPFLPIQFFKSHQIKTTGFEPQIVFTSSGTTGMTTSQHFVRDVSIYERSFIAGWQQFYSPIPNYCVLALLPSYLERSGSSLIYMAEDFIKQSTHELSDFYLDEHEHLYLILNELEKDKQPTLLLGVTYALLDFATKYRMNLQYTTVMETGGMKGRRKEMTRQEVHGFLKHQLGCATIHSEYGMTELLSQAYSKENGVFVPSNTMQVLVRNEDDPLQVTTTGKGLLNIIDLANVYSCAFIATDDIGVVKDNGHFEVQGRADASDIRGCSLLTA